MNQPGYWIAESVFSNEECENIMETISLSEIISGRGGTRNLMAIGAIAELAKDVRLLNFTRQITGSDLIPYKALLFEKTGKANWLVAWHQDTALPVENAPTVDGWGLVSVKEGITFAHAPTSALSKILALRIHLDASRPENGPLRVIAGSHRTRIFDDSEFIRWLDKGEKAELLVGKGGVIAMSPLLIHASSKCMTDEPRRVLHIEYSPALELSHGIRLAIA